MIAGFLKVRNEILREGNLYRVLAQLEKLCSCGVICDDASTDGTAEHLRAWVAARPHFRLIEIPAAEQRFQNEMGVKQRMLDVLHTLRSVSWPHVEWILWLDGDELVDRRGEAELHSWLVEHKDEADIWAFHYTQLWGSQWYARTDSDFDEGWYWKLWRYRPDLSFEKVTGLHFYQFPEQYKHVAVQAVQRSDFRGRARHAPFDIIHLGNFGKNLVWKCIQYADDARRRESHERHLYFGRKKPITTRDVPVDLFPEIVLSQLTQRTERRMFSDEHVSRIERMGTLKQIPGLFVVIVPTYNRGAHLLKTLESVCRQTDEHWVAVVLDDGSTDETPRLMQGLCDRDPRIFYARYNENRGGVAMNEIGMALACEMGEFWVRLGSDDGFEPHKLALDRAAFEAGAQACYGPYRDHHESGLGREIRNAPGAVRSQLLSRGFAASWANIAVRTSVLKDVRATFGDFCDVRIRNMEDWVANTRIAQLADFTWRGLTKDGQLVVGARAWSDVPGGSTNIEHDGFWRIAADGASNKHAIINEDARLSNEAITASFERKKPIEAPIVPLQVRSFR